MRAFLMLVMGLSGSWLVFRSFRTVQVARQSTMGERLSGGGLLLLTLSSVLARGGGGSVRVGLGVLGLLGLLGGVALMVSGTPNDDATRRRGA